MVEFGEKQKVEMQRLKATQRNKVRCFDMFFLREITTLLFIKLFKAEKTGKIEEKEQNWQRFQARFKHCGYKAEPKRRRCGQEVGHK